MSMFSSASNILITGGSFNTPETPQAPVPPQQITRSRRPPIHVYVEHLSREGRGHPLWLPEPSRNLPPEYRAQGVSIGDVGVIKPSGAFDFFFNITHPASHPINSRCPVDFQHLDPPPQEHDIDENVIFSAGSSLASSSIRRVQGGLSNGGLQFESSASEGAVLAMPDATFQSDLNDLDRFYQHIGAHAESWYRHANGPGMGRRLDNGDLCLVIGCDKTTSWGIATFSNSMDQMRSQLQLLPVASSPGGPGCPYTWVHSGTADSPRVGPHHREPLGQLSHNQCLFVRYLTLKLRKHTLPGFRGPSRVQVQMRSHQSTSTGTLQPNSPNLGSSSTFGLVSSRFLGSVFGSRGRDSVTLSELTEDPLEIIAESYMVSEMTPLSTYLNDYLLEKLPEAKVAATRGVEWYLQYTSGTKPLKTFSDFIASILCDHEICLNTSGVAYFQLKEDRKLSSSSHVVSALGTIADAALTRFEQPALCLSTTLQAQFEQLSELKDLDMTTVLHREASKLHPPGHPLCFSSLSNLANTVLAQFHELGKLDDLEEATILHRAALELCPPGHPDHTITTLNNLADAVRIRFKLLGKLKDLEEATVLLRDALELCPPGHTLRSSSLNNLAITILAQFEQLGKIENLMEATVLLREALELCPPGHLDRSASLNNLASTVQIQSQQFGKLGDLEEATALLREALELCPPGHTLRSSTLNNLAITILAQFEQLGKIETLKEATILLREALELRPPGHLDRSASLNNLAGMVQIQFQQFGKLEDLEEATILLREALELRPPGHPNRSSTLTNLANTVQIRFQQLGNLEDLKEATALHREASELRSLGLPGYSTSLMSFGTTSANPGFTMGDPEGEACGRSSAYHVEPRALPPSTPSFDSAPPIYLRMASVSNRSGSSIQYSSPFIDDHHSGNTTPLKSDIHRRHPRSLPQHERYVYTYRLLANSTPIQIMISVEPTSGKPTPGKYNFRLSFKANGIERPLCEPTSRKLKVDPRHLDFVVFIFPGKANLPTGCLWSLRVWLRVNGIDHRLFGEDELWVGKDPDFHSIADASFARMKSAGNGEQVYNAYVGKALVTFIVRWEPVSSNLYKYSVEYDANGVGDVLLEDIRLRLDGDPRTISFLIFSTPSNSIPAGASHKLRIWIRSVAPLAAANTSANGLPFNDSYIYQRIWKEDSFKIGSRLDFESLGAKMHMGFSTGGPETIVLPTASASLDLSSSRSLFKEKRAGYDF